MTHPALPHDNSAAHCVQQFRGHTVRYGPGEALKALHRRRGPVLSVPAGRTRYVYLLGAEANRFVFARSELFRWKEAFAGLTPVDGETALIVSDGPDHRRRRRLVQPALHHKQVNRYLDIMAESADSAIDTLRTNRSADAYGLFREAIRRSTLRSLFGPELASDAHFFGQHLQALLTMVDGLPQKATLHRRLRTPAWQRAMRGRARVDERIYAEIARVRHERPGTTESVLDSLVHGHDDEGDTLSDAEIRDQAVSLIAAGYETTSAAMAWAIYSLLSVPGVWEQAHHEVHTILENRRPTADDLTKLTYLNGVVRETLRLYPPAVVSARKAATEFTFAGRRVPMGSMVLYSPYVTHRLPIVWSDPLSFRPARWDPDAPGYRKPAPHEFLPFGAGPHRCIGSTMATTELTVMLARLLARTSLRLPVQRVRATSFAAMRPRHGLVVECLSLD